MAGTGPVVVATDLSPGGARAVDLAVHVAKDLGAPLRIVHAVDRGPSEPAGREASPAERALRARLTARLAETRARLEDERTRAAGQGASVEAELLDGRPWEAVVEDAERVGARVLVVGPHGHGGPSEILRSAALEWLLGVTADRVVRHAGCPVLVAPHQGPIEGLRDRPWLVAIDFEAPSRDALARALRLAARCDARLVGLHVVPTLPPLTADDGAIAGWDPADEEADAQARLDAFVAEVQADVAGSPGVPAAPPVRTLVVRGEPAEQIVAAADEARAGLVVMGTHGRTGLTHALLGSVAERVLRRARVPVLSVRPRRA